MTTEIREVSPAKHTTNGGGSGEWQTPPDLFARLNRRFRFTYDAFASHSNALCDTYSTVDGTFRKDWPSHQARWEGPDITQIDSLDGLRQDWDCRRVFMNPPYSRGFLAPAMRKAAEARNEAEVIVAVIPDARDTKWWREYVRPFAVDFPIGRVRFIDPVTGEPGGSPPGGTAVVIYIPDWMKP